MSLYWAPPFNLSVCGTERFLAQLFEDRYIMQAIVLSLFLYLSWQTFPQPSCLPHSGNLMSYMWNLMSYILNLMSYIFNLMSYMLNLMSYMFPAIVSSPPCESLCVTVERRTVYDRSCWWAPKMCTKVCRATSTLLFYSLCMRDPSSHWHAWFVVMGPTMYVRACKAKSSSLFCLLRMRDLSS